MIQYETGPERPAFERSFNELFDLTAGAPYDSVWFRFVETHGLAEGEPVTDEDIQVFQLTKIIDTHGVAHSPDHSQSNDLPGTYQYQRWTIGANNPPENFSELVREYQLESPGHRMPSFFPRTANVPNVCDVFGKRAEDSTQLALVTNRLITWSGTAENEQQHPVDNAVLSRIVGDILVKNFTFPDSETVANESVLDEFAQLEAQYPLHRRIARHASNALGKMLLGIPIGSYPKEVVEQLDKSSVVQGITQLDESGVIPDSFWIDFGIRAGATVKSPDFLPALYAKLTGSDGPQILDGRINDTQELSRAYITGVLSGYTRDPQRHTENATRLLRASKPDTRPHSHVSLSKVIAVSNTLPSDSGVAGGEATRRQPVRPYDDIDMVYLASAFQLLLTFTRPLDLPADEQARQFEQDQLHTGIVELIRQGASYRKGR